jgi:hypothetical protein
MFAVQHKYGSIAQLVEQRIENPRVGGSIPPRATKFKKAPFFTDWRFFYNSHQHSAILPCA